jgi:hypothetical protein
MEWIVLHKVLASIFIISFCALQLFWCLPEGYIMRKIIHRLFYNQVVWCGLDHYWSLFAPNPVSSIVLISFEIKFTDTTSIPWTIPEFKIKDGFQYITKARDLKWYYSLISSEYEAPKEAVCKYILHAFMSGSNNEKVPDMIQIILHFKPKGLIKFLNFSGLRHIAYTYKVTSL